MARMPSTLGERAVPRATRRLASYDPSQGLGLQRRGLSVVDENNALGNRALAAGYDALGTGISNASEVLYRKAEEERIKDEERAVKNLEVEWSKKRREILFGDGSPNKPGFFATAGEDTINSRKGVEDELNKQRGLILGKASNLRVKQAFDLSSTASLQGELEQMDRYTIGQRREANTASSKAAIDEAMQQAATYYSDDAKWESAVARIASETAAMGDNEGWSQDVINNTTQSFIGEAAKNRIRRALMTDAKSGEELYMRSRDMIDGDTRIEIEQDIHNAKKAEETEKRLAAAEARAAAADLDKAAFTDWASKIVAGEPVSAKDIALDNRMDGQSKLTLANALEQKTKPTEQKTDYGVFNDLFARIHAPDDDPKKIKDWHELIPYQKYMKFSDWEQLRGEAEKDGTEEGQMQNKFLDQTLDYAKNMLTGRNELLGMRDPKGEELLQKAYVSILTEWDKGLKAGKNPADMSNPESPDFVGKVVKSLQRPMNVMMKDIFDASKGFDVGTDEAVPGAAKPTGELPVVDTDEEYAKLPSGAKFKDKDGKEYTKP